MDKIDEETPEWVQSWPKMRGGNPTWWNSLGDQMENRSRSLSAIVFGCDHAKLEIKPKRSALEVPPTFILSWVVWPSGRDSAEYFSGAKIFDIPTLEAAFGLNNLSHRSGIWMIRQYSANAARHGYFIRFGEHVNFPGPGVGLSPDPNISLRLKPRFTRLVAAAIKRATFLKS